MQIGLLDPPGVHGVRLGGILDVDDVESARLETAVDVDVGPRELLLDLHVGHMQEAALGNMGNHLDVAAAALTRLGIIGMAGPRWKWGRIAGGIRRLLSLKERGYQQKRRDKDGTDTPNHFCLPGQKRTSKQRRIRDEGGESGQNVKEMRLGRKAAGRPILR